MCLWGRTGSNGLPNLGAGRALKGLARKEVAADEATTVVRRDLIAENFGDLGIVTRGAGLGTALGKFSVCRFVTGLVAKLGA